MVRILLTLLAATCFGLSAGGSARPLDVEALLEDLAERVSKSGRDDPGDREAIALIDSLGASWGAADEDERDDIVRGLDRVFLAQRRADRDGRRETRLYEAAARALGRTGDDGARRLLRWVGHPKHKRDVALQRQLVLALGETRSDLAIKPLSKLLGEDAPPVLSAAATALGQFRAKDQKVRKMLFEDLLKTLESARENARGNDSTAGALWGAVRGPGLSSLAKLSGARAGDVESWRRWWNKNKRKSWEA